MDLFHPPTNYTYFTLKIFLKLQVLRRAGKFKCSHLLTHEFSYDIQLIVESHHLSLPFNHPIFILPFTPKKGH
jgi:hypothetical protein